MGLNAKFENFKNQIEKWSFLVQNGTVSTMHSFFSSSFDAANPPAKKRKNVKCQHPSPAKTQRLIPILMKITAPGR
jgi:hypothetical protein